MTNEVVTNGAVTITDAKGRTSERTDSLLVNYPLCARASTQPSDTTKLHDRLVAQVLACRIEKGICKEALDTAERRKWNTISWRLQLEKTAVREQFYEDLLQRVSSGQSYTMLDLIPEVK